MKRKLVKVLVIVLLLTGGIIAAYALSPSEENLTLDVASVIGGIIVDGKEVVKVSFTFDFDKKPMFSSEQNILVQLDKHWIIYAYKLQENGRYRGNEKIGHWNDYEVAIKIDPSIHFNKDLKGEGYALLIPRNHEEVIQVQTSAISIEYHFDGYLKNFKEVDSTSWENESVYQ